MISRLLFVDDAHHGRPPPSLLCLSSSITMDYEDTADLLGNKEMPIVRPQQSGFSSYFSLRNALLLIIALLSFAFLLRPVFVDVYVWFRRWNDQSSKL